MTAYEISEIMQFDTRQSDYYYNAGKYLGLFEKKKEEDQIIIHLTKLGKQIFKQDYRERQLSIVSRILEHQIFADLFDYSIEKGELPERNTIIQKMQYYNVCGRSQIGRRASSVSAWLRWIFNLIKL